LVLFLKKKELLDFFCLPHRPAKNAAATTTATFLSPFIHLFKQT